MCINFKKRRRKKQQEYEEKTVKKTGDSAHITEANKQNNFIEYIQRKITRTEKTDSTFSTQKNVDRFHTRISVVRIRIHGRTRVCMFSETKNRCDIRIRHMLRFKAKNNNILHITKMPTHTNQMKWTKKKEWNSEWLYWMIFIGFLQSSARLLPIRKRLSLYLLTLSD